MRAIASILLAAVVVLAVGALLHMAKAKATTPAQVSASITVSCNSDGTMNVKTEKKP